MEEQEFINIVRNVRGPRNHKVKNSFGVYDGYKYYRKNKPKDKKYILSESQYFSIIRMVNSLFAEALLSGDDVVLPCRFGRLELRKRNAGVYFKDGKLKYTLPIEWDRTLKLWYEDEESYKNKTLVRIEEKEVYKLYYNKNVAEYNNKSFYLFNFNRDLKRQLKTNIKKGNIDAFNFKQYD